MNELHIRMATVSDAIRLVEIYTPYVENTGITFEYEVPSVSEFASRIEQIIALFPYLVAVRNDQIVGYAYASYYRTRQAYAWNVETSIYMDEHARGKGDGKALYLALERVLTAQGVTNLNACIAVPNPTSVRFHEKLGYQRVAEFHQSGYKLGKWYDTVWFEKIINEHTVPPRPIVSWTELNLTKLLF